MFSATAGLCYFITCMSLQQCQQYRTSILPALPARTNVDVFYWMNHEGVEVGANDISLLSILEETSILSHWNYISPEAQSWLPWYRYKIGSECSAYVKLDLGLVLLNRVSNYPSLLSQLVEQAHGKSTALINLEPSCAERPEYGLASASILLNLPLLQQLLDQYQTNTVESGTRFYSSGDFALFIATNGQALNVQSADQTYCAQAETLDQLETVPEPYAFARLKDSSEEAHPLELAGLLKNAGNQQVVF